MITNKRISIILPSYNDLRIERAINSIRQFDDIDSVKIIVIDGGSSNEIKDLITSCLSSHDIFISEPDKGIFDALNKGLDVCDTDFIGWLGSDDMFTGKVPASQVVKALEKNDLFIADLYFFKNGYVTRKTHGLPSRVGLMKFGLHNPHYATFGAAKLLKSEKFRLDLRGSDIDYFIRIFNKKPEISSTSVVATLQEEGGYSNSSVLGILKTNLELLKFFGILGPVSIIIKLSYKLLSTIYFRVLKVTV